MSNQNQSYTIVSCNYSGAFNSAYSRGMYVNVNSWAGLRKSLVELFMNPSFLIWGDGSKHLASEIVNFWKMN